MIHNTVSVGVGEKFRAIAHQTSGGNFEFKVSHAAFPCIHVEHFSFACAELFHDRADIILGNLYHKQLDRLTFLSFDFLVDDLWTRYLKFEILAAHGFNQDGKMQLAAPRYLEAVSGIGFLNAHSDVCFDLFKQTVADVAAGNIFSFSSGKRGIIDHKHH